MISVHHDIVNWCCHDGQCCTMVSCAGLAIISGVHYGIIGCTVVLVYIASERSVHCEL